MAKWFSDKEVAGLKPRLVAMLDQMRTECGFPLTISSGFRTAKANSAIGGKPNSAHLRGLAADIPCTESDKRFKLVLAAYHAGFRRIEVATKHIHVDCDDSLPQYVMPVDISR